MTAWTKLFLLLLLLTISAKVDGRAAAKIKEKAGAGRDHDFSKEGKTSSSYEEDNNEEEYSEESVEEDDGVLVVCRENGHSRCHCDVKGNRIDCQREHLTIPEDEDEDEFLIESANIKAEIEGFKPKYVYLNHNKITKIDPEELLPGIEDSVEGIDFGLNAIKEIYEGAFDKFKNLRKLRLNHNRIKIDKHTDGWINDKLGNSLILLNMAYNGITALPDKIFDPLHKLDKLILDGNKFKLTSNTFGPGLKSLTMLSLDNCNFSTFPDDAFKNLPNLAYLSLIDNPMNSIPKAIISIKSLHALDLSNTDFTTLSGSPLKELTSLNRLYMKDMKKMKEFGDCAFCGLTNLTEIDIGGNKNMAAIDDNAFGFAKDDKSKTINITTFQVDGCNLTFVPEKLLPWEKLKKIVLGKNPWDCGDPMHYFIYDLNIHTLAEKDQAKCNSPPDLNGTTLARLISENQAGGVMSFIKTIFFMGISIGIVGIILVGFLHFHSKYGGIANLFNRNRSTGVGFSNLNADVGMEDERVFEEDEDDNEFEPRPAAV